MIWLDIISPVNSLTRPMEPENFSTRTLEYLMQDLNVPGDRYKVINMRNLTIGYHSDCRYPSMEDWLFVLRFIVNNLDVQQLEIRNLSWLDISGVKHCLRTKQNKYHTRVWSSAAAHEKGVDADHVPCSDCRQEYHVYKDGFDAYGRELSSSSSVTRTNHE